jgi:phosphoribosylamine--glycine ligase
LFTLELIKGILLKKLFVRLYMNILLIGSGGREHALALSLSKSKSCAKLFAAPGNPGIFEIASKTYINPNNTNEIINFCKKEQIDLVVVGPEQPLAEGLSDILNGVGITTFGPSKFCSQLESSKDFAKNIMMKSNIPTAAYRTFSKSEMIEAHKYLDTHTLPIVLKADGLAAGKGVVIAEDYDTAHNSIDEMFGGIFGSAGNRVVVEEFMDGEEASVFVVTDGNDYIILPPSQDHKRVGDGDTGKNTGGMGAFAPAKIVNLKVMQQVENNILKPLLAEFNCKANPYRGLLYIGLMIKDNTPKVVEFNVRFGDPETQVVLPLVQGDLAKLFLSAANGTLDKDSINIDSDKNAVCIVLSSGGYPDEFQKGYEIQLPKMLNENEIIYHAGTTEKDGKILTNGGRVLGATTVGTDLKSTIADAYNLVNKIHFENMYYRNDIAKKGILVDN